MRKSILNGKIRENSINDNTRCCYNIPQYRPFVGRKMVNSLLGNARTFLAP